ncbi:MAG: hypothetical protein ACOC5D_00790 [Thermoplasmatota archaeon]
MFDQDINLIIKKRKFNLFLLSVSLFLGLITLFKTNIGSPEPSAFWYASSLYFTFWIGITLTIISILLSYHHGNLIKISGILILVFYIYTIPTYTHDLVPVFDVYHVIPNPLNILETGHIDYKTITFPLSHVFYASNIEILNMDGLSYARLFPTILVSSIIISLISISKRISKRWSFIAPIAFISFNWFMEYHMARQGYTLILWALFLLSFTLFLNTKNKRLAALTILSIFSIFIAHPGMTIFLFFNIISLSVISILFIKNKNFWNYLKPTLICLTAMILVFLLVYYSFSEIQMMIDDIYQRVMDNSFQGIDLGYRIESSARYSFINSIRLVMMGLQSLLGLIGLIVGYLKKSPKITAVGVIFLSCYFWLIYPLSFHGHLIERTFMASLIPSTLLIAYLFKTSIFSSLELNRIYKTTIIVILIFFLLCIPLTKNSIDSFETPSKEAYDAGRFAQNSMNETIYVTDTHEGLFRYLEATSNSSIYFNSISGGRVEGIKGIHTGYPKPTTSRENLDNHLFLDYFKNYFIIRFGNTTVAEELDEYERYYSENQSKIYDARGARLYKDTHK